MRTSQLRRREAITAYAFLAPVLLGFTLFVLGPLLASVVLAFFEWDLFTPATFVGFDNLAALPGDPLIGRTLLNTAIFAVGAETLNVSLGLLIAVGIDRLASRRLAFAIRSAYFMPFIMSTAVVAVLWGFLLQRDLGVVNWMLGRIGIGPVPFLTSSTWAMPTIILIDVWKNLGFFVVLFLAGLQSIPRHLGEAARLDGAGDVGVFRHITLPLLTPTVFFAVVIALIGASQVFESVYVLTGGGPGDATRTIVMYLYQEGFQAFNLGYASAIALLLFGIVLALTVIQFRISRRWVVSR